jgi:hypothetical protein
MPAVAASRVAPAEIDRSVPQLQSAAPYDTGLNDSGRTATTLLPDERDEPLRLLALIGPAMAISVLTILGLTITFGALRQDLRQRRVVYRRRNHRRR